MPPSRRARASFAALALSTAALGLLVHLAGSPLPSVLQDMLGDALWALMIAWIAGAVVPGLPRRVRAVAALAFCWAVEVSQLFHTPMLDNWRTTTIGHLTLGTDFDPRDLAAYAVGVLGALALEPALLSSIASLGSRRSRAN